MEGDKDCDSDGNIETNLLKDSEAERQRDRDREKERKRQRERKRERERYTRLPSGSKFGIDTIRVWLHIAL